MGQLVTGGASGGTLNNCIVYYNAGGNYSGSYSVYPLMHCCTTPLPTNGIGNITSPPLFVDTNGWSNLRLQSNSPCINAGNNGFVTWSTDLNGNPRIVSGIVDMGAYEFVPPTPPTPAEAVERLITRVNESDLRHKQPLLVTLNAALASIQRGNCRSAVGQLRAFQNKVRVQVINLVLAEELNTSAGQVIAALGGDGSPPVACKVQSVQCQPNGWIQLQFSGRTGRRHWIEASTNLVNWEVVGAACEQGPGNFAFEDTEAARHPRRFYRIVEQQ